MIDQPDDVILHTLEFPDRHAELHPLLAVLHRQIEHRLAAADHERAQHRQRAEERTLELRPTLALAASEKIRRRDLDALERHLVLPREKAWEPARSHAARSRIDQQQAHVGGPVAGAHGHDQMSRRGRVAHEQLGAVEPKAISEPLRPQRDRLRTPRGVRIRDGHAEDDFATRDRRQDGVSLLSARRFQHDERAEHARAPERARHRSAAQFLEEHSGVGKRALAAAVLRGHEDAGPADVHGLAPQRRHQARRLALERDDRVRRRLALDERAGGRSQHLLRFGQGQVHGQAPLCSCRHCRTSPPWLQAAPAAIAMATKIVSAISASPAPAMAAFCV